MTSSFQSTSFQSSARPVDTFVRQSTVPLIEEDGFSQLTKALSAVNPVLDMFMKRTIEEEQAEGMDLAMEESINGFKDIAKDVSKKNGDEAARRFIGGSMFTDRAYQKPKAHLFGNSAETILSNSYSTTIINGKALSEYSLDSEEYQNWLSTERDNIIQKLDGIKSIYVNEHFMPKLASATETIASHHLKENNSVRLENVKSLAVPLVRNLIISPDSLDEKLILDYETTINELGLPAKDRSDINKTLVNSIMEAAEAKALNGDTEGVNDTLAIASKFPYGPKGNLTLIDHPDFQSKFNTIKRQVNTYEYQNARRYEIMKKQAIDNEVDQGLRDFIATGDASIIEDLSQKYPTRAKSILSNANILDLDGRTSYLDLRINIQTRQFTDKADAIKAVTDWMGTVENSVQNRDNMIKLLNYIDKTFDGQYDIVNRSLKTLESRLSGELKKPNSGFWSNFTGQLNADGTKIKNDLLIKASREFFEWTESEEGSKATDLEQEQKGIDIIEKYINEARKSVPQIQIESGVGNTQNTDENQSERQEQDMSNIEGDLEAGAFTDDDTPTTVTVEQGDTLTQLAEQFSTTVEAIMRANNITNADLIQAGQELIMPVGDGLPFVITDGSKQQAIVSAANELGVRPEDLAAVISQETMGTFDPQIIGGEGNNYKGLIQFGIPERKAYGYRDGMSFEEQLLGPVVRYLKDRGVKQGHGVKELYAAILTGNVSTLDTDGLTRKDSFGTSVESALPELNQGGSHYNNAIDFLSEQGRFQQNSN